MQEYLISELYRMGGEKETVGFTDFRPPGFVCMCNPANRMP